jgi:hypothetical protein
MLPLVLALALLDAAIYPSRNQEQVSGSEWEGWNQRGKEMDRKKNNSEEH